jgi:hypothetical protein
VTVTNRVRQEGASAIVRGPAQIGAVAWWVGLAIEYPYGLFPPGDGSVIYVIDQGIFVAALVAWLVALVRWQTRNGEI